ncbi:MAG: hypothetical protein ABIL09_26240, partial [Gemmatimonadota bacterium]
GPFPTLSFRREGSTTLSLDRYVQDDGPDALIVWTWSIPGGSVTVELDAGRTATVSAATGFEGVATISFTATDARGATGTATATVTVLPPLAPPAPGDFDGSGAVDLDDFFLLADHLGLTVLSPRWNPVCDLDGDGRVSFDDFFMFCDLYERARLESSR